MEWMGVLLHDMHGLQVWNVRSLKLSRCISESD